MNVLLLYPEFPDTFWSFKHALKFIGKKASLPPLGLLTVAAMLPRDWAKRLVDVNVRPLHDRDLASGIQNRVGHARVDAAGAGQGAGLRALVGDPDDPPVNTHAQRTLRRVGRGRGLACFEPALRACRSAPLHLPRSAQMNGPASGRVQPRVVDYRAPEGGSLRVARGGSWLYGPKASRSANRDSYGETTRCSDLGFRLVLALRD
jgi:hypothetical protein